MFCIGKLQISNNFYGQNKVNIENEIKNDDHLSSNNLGSITIKTNFFSTVDQHKQPER